ncbi:MAG: 3-hydroxyacyl-ACP dehydratase [Flavobacteriales bacterium]|nr:3-hydroxyacyl-ACP dehydratase [Flavobacteriales bacterium]
MIADEKNISEFIPQGPPVIMIDRIQECSENSIITRFYIKKENLFSEEGFFTESGLIENMAQTAAARAGVESKTKGKAPQKGFIAAIKNLKIHSLPEVDTEITTYLSINNQVMNFSIANAYITQRNSKIAECELKIFIPE